MIDGKKTDISDETAKNFREQFKDDKGVWVPSGFQTVYCAQLEDDYIRSDDANSFVDGMNVQHIYKDEDTARANKDLHKYISEMIKKYGWIEMGEMYCEIDNEFDRMIRRAGRTKDTAGFLGALHMQRNGTALHSKSTQEERDKMIGLIKKANEYLTK